MKIVLNNVNSGYNLSAIQSNFDKIASELNNKVLYRNNPIGEPNGMTSSIDANGFTVFNLRMPTLSHEAATKGYVDSGFISSILPYVQAAQQAAAEALISEQNAADSALDASLSAEQAFNSALDAQTSAVNAASSAVDAQLSAQAAQSYSELGLGGAAGFDFGYVTDPVIIFPTDFGSIV